MTRHEVVIVGGGAAGIAAAASMLKRRPGLDIAIVEPRDVHDYHGGVLQPTFPSWLIDGTKPSHLAWLLKKDLLPPLYWFGMLKGHEWLARPKPLARAH